MREHHITDEMLQIFYKFVSEFSRRHLMLRYIFLDVWRGQTRLIIDSACSNDCHNACAHCLHLDFLNEDSVFTDGVQQFPLGLFEWTEPEDIALFGPERYMQCKTMDRYASCFIEFILYDTSTQNLHGLIKELELIRDVRVLWSPGGDIQGARTLLSQLVIDDVIEKADEKMTGNMQTALDFLGWNGQTWGNKDETEV